MSTAQRNQETSKTDKLLAAFAKSSCNWPFFMPLTAGRTLREQGTRR